MNSFFENREVFLMSMQDLKECKIITAFITPFHEDGSINLMPFQP